MMKNPISIIALALIASVLLLFRAASDEINVTTWDSFGYYYFLPGHFIYDDIDQLEWLDEMDSKYGLTGGELYQTRQLENGNHVGKYFLGISILESPFFGLGHLIAQNSDYPADGFSKPYQYSIAYGLILYFMLGLFVLRKILLRYYNDLITTYTLLLIALATNAIQYASVDSGMSHGYIFLLYCLLILFTIKWHERPKPKWAALIGLTMGIAVLCRPTEAVMLFIPLFWGINDRASAKQKWKLLKDNKIQLIPLILFGVIGIIPQLIYWKTITGDWVYNVGSKWDFLTPHLRVLIGWEKGWFIYTPITIFFILGLFFLKKHPYKRSVVAFSLINIYIIISWHDWRYGGGFSTRAMVQSYPVFALAMAALIEHFSKTKWKIPIYLISSILLILNVFQIWQYNSGIIHYYDMNGPYYRAVFMDSNPSPLDYSLLDKNPMHREYCESNGEELFDVKSIELNSKINDPSIIILDEKLLIDDENLNFLLLKAKIKTYTGLGSSFLRTEIQHHDETSTQVIRLFTPRAKENEVVEYIYYIDLESNVSNDHIKIFVEPHTEYDGYLESLKIYKFTIP